MKKFVSFVSIVMILAIFLTTVALAQHTHLWVTWTTDVPPTCLTEGRQVSRCARGNCGTHAYRTVAKLDHYYVPATCTEPKHCVNGCNRTIGEKLPHTFAAATCVQRPKCTVCDYEEGQLGKHVFEDRNCLQPRTCKVCGVSSGAVTNHDYMDATCQTPATCKRCGATTGGVRTHQYSKATCAETAKCKWCDKTQRGEHQWVTVGNETTCSVCHISRLLKMPKPEPICTE